MAQFITRHKMFALLLVFSLTMALAGCSGDDGAAGPAGPTGQTGQTGQAGQDGQDGQDGVGLGSAAIKTLVINNLKFGIDSNSFITASFQVTDGTSPVTGLKNTASTIYLAGLVAGASGDADEWQYWTGVDDTTLVENPAGTYLLTANKKTTDAPAGTTTQRGVARIALTGYNTVVKTYDFALSNPATPVAAAKDVVNDASCKDCHGYGVTIHSYGRNDTKVCVVCHSPKYNATIADHEADFVTMVHQIHSNKATTLGALHVSGHGENWPGIVYPMMDKMLNCNKCHNTVAEADNWKNKPTKAACDSCHTTIKFDGSAYNGIKSTATVPVAGTTHNEANNAACRYCHSATKMAADHKPAANRDASQRLVTAEITKVEVDANGGVTVSFNAKENGVAKTNVAASGTSFTLAKLVPASSGTPSYWQSYLSKVRTKDATMAPVIQGRTEAATDGGILTHTGNGSYTYKFKLLNAATANSDGTGDIRTINRAINNSSGITGAYLPANGLTQMAYPVSYEPTRTHRVAMALTGIKTNAFLDFVPGGNKAETRNIVSRDACNKCHGDSQLHAGFALEYCVGCHNQNTYDPYSGPTGLGTLATTDTAVAGSSSVELERIIHKIHMGKDLENGFRVNTAPTAATGHIYSRAQYPSGVAKSSSTPNASDCKVCHDESNTKMTEATKWRYGTRACGSCHDGAMATAHINTNTYQGFASCGLCHAPGKLMPVDTAHYGISK